MADDWLEKFIQWCRDQKEVAQESLDMMEAGNLHLYSNDVDVSDRHMNHLRHVIENMNKIVADHEASQSA